MRLLRNEWVRFWSRRIVRFGSLIILALCLFGVGIAFITINAQYSDAELEERVVKLEECNNRSFSSEPDFDGPVSAQESEEREFAQSCESVWNDLGGGFWFTQTLDQSSSDWSKEYGSNPERVVEKTDAGNEYTEPLQAKFPEGVLVAFGLTGVALAAVLGGSFIGAEYRSGTIENLLLWVPSRIKVFAVKAVAGALGMAILTAILSLLLTGMLFLLAQFKGTFLGIDSVFWSDYVGMVVRISLMWAAFFLLAFSIATVTRHTVAAVGVVLGWSVVASIAAAFLPKLAPWELFTNMNAYITQGDVGRRLTESGRTYSEFSHSSSTAALVVFAWAVIPLLIAAVVFQRRDLS